LEPDARLTEQLINRYWRDWHRQLDAIAADSSIKFVLDCHSMAAMGPSHYSDPGALRPRAQVANLGDSEGRREPKRDLITASPQIVQRLAHLFGGALRDLPDLAPSDNCCWINAPFWGGWDLWGRGGAQQPWVMFELSRALYIGEQSGDTPLVRPNAYWINQLRERIWGVVESFVTTYL
jgi:N-formylglutamate amidohydrolase